MININVIARIADDKNSFLDVVYMLYKLKEDNINDVNVYFIGAIQNYGIYNCVINMAELLAVQNQVSFSKKSIRIEDIPPDVREGYFLHFCIGDFKGYSGMDSINNGLKNIFYNADRKLNLVSSKYPNLCVNINGLIEFVKNIFKDPADADKNIEQSDLKILEDTKLSQADKKILLSILLPK